MPGSSAHETLQGGYWNGYFLLQGENVDMPTPEIGTHSERHAEDTARGLPSAKQSDTSEETTPANLVLGFLVSRTK